MCAQIPLAASKGGMFPKQFGALTDRKVPAFGIISSTALASIAVIISYLGTSDATVFTTLVLRGSMTQPTAVPEAQEAAR